VDIEAEVEEIEADNTKEVDITKEEIKPKQVSIMKRIRSMIIEAIEVVSEEKEVVTEQEEPLEVIEEASEETEEASEVTEAEKEEWNKEE
jgi:hypothetical protein